MIDQTESDALTTALQEAASDPIAYSRILGKIICELVYAVNAGSAGGTPTKTHTVSSGDITAKGFQLSPVPAGTVVLLPAGNIPQIQGPDFTVDSGGFLSWNGLGFASLVTVGQSLVLIY